MGGFLSSEAGRDREVDGPGDGEDDELLFCGIEGEEDEPAAWWLDIIRVVEALWTVVGNQYRPTTANHLWGWVTRNSPSVVRWVLGKRRVVKAALKGMSRWQCDKGGLCVCKASYLYGSCVTVFRV